MSNPNLSGTQFAHINGPTKVSRVEGGFRAEKSCQACDMVSVGTGSTSHEARARANTEHHKHQGVLQ